MSETAGPFDPAIGLLEFDSVATGIVAGDAMVKSSPISSLYAGTVHPGRYLILVGGDTAAVEVALESGTTDAVLDSLFLADVHPAVVAAITTTDPAAPMADDALGIVETSTAATAIVAADAGVKAAGVSLLALRLSDDLGGKAYCLFAGTTADVEAAVELALAGIGSRGRLVGTAIIPRLHPEMWNNLASELRFNQHIRRGDGAS